METGIILVAIVVLLIAGVGVGLWVARREHGARSQTETSALTALLDTLRSEQSALEGRLKALSESHATGQTTLLKTLEERLDTVSHRVGQTLSESTTKTAESLGNLHQRLATIDEAQKNITELSGQVVSLQDILSNKQTRGAFGEIQLMDIVKKALPPSAYTFQATLSNRRRPDCLVHLPNPPGPIVIDSKFPLSAYNALVAAENDDMRKKAARDFRTDMTNHIRAISEGYIVPGETAESALMFLPSEAVYAELHTSFHDVLEKSYTARVWIVSPTTLMATLNTVRAVLKDTQMREQAGVIQAEVSFLLKDISLLQDRVTKLETHFGQAGRDIQQIVTSADKITRRGHKIENLQIEGDGDEALPTAESEPGTVSSLFAQGGQ